MQKKMAVLFCVLAFGVTGGAAATRVTAESAGAIDASTVDAVTAEPVLLTTFCFVPTRATLAAYRADCDEYSEKGGFAHGVLRPKNDNDGPLSANCQAVPAGQPAPEIYVCLGVGHP